MEQRLAQLQLKMEADASFGEKLFSLETPEEVQSFLKEQGLEFTLEEIDELRVAMLKALQQAEDGELSDEDLENVAGGSLIGTIVSIIFGAAKLTHSVTRGRW